MGFTPKQTKAMSLRDFNTITTGLQQLRGGKRRAEPMSDEQMAALGIEGA